MLLFGVGNDRCSNERYQQKRATVIVYMDSKLTAHQRHSCVIFTWYPMRIFDYVQ